MASGLAIVAYRYAAAREHLEDGRSALLAPFDDAAAFIAAAKRMVQDMGFARSLGQAARSVAQFLTWDRVVLDFEQVLADVAH